MAAAWFKGVQCRICLDYNDTVNKLSLESHAPPPDSTDAPVLHVTAVVLAAAQAGAVYSWRFAPVLCI